jgi:hypothetical protein
MRPTDITFLTVNKFPFRTFHSDGIRERLSETFLLKPLLSRIVPRNLLLD